FNNTGGGDNPATTDPTDAIDYYNYMTGYWKDGSELLYGGTGHMSSSGATNTATDFMFPGNPTTDECGWGQDGEVMPDWSEETEDNEPYDRRFVQSAGPFTLTPGAVNDITVGAVYARATSGGPWASVEAVRKADDKAQILFEDCFRVLNGPDAPELKIVEMDKKLIFHIYNKEISNNYLEEYKEKDSRIICTGDLDPCDEYYRFQGYQVFQLKNESAGITDRHNKDKVREIFQCDVKDDVKQLVNYYWSDELGANEPKEMVNGDDEGIKHSFEITEDQFASGDKRLINHRHYHYTAIAYGYNETEAYDQQVQETFNGQKKPYLAGRNNIKKYKAMPHLEDPASEGTELQAEYGYGPEITQIEGYGNGNNVLDLKEETIETIMDGSPWKDHTPTYQNGKGPVGIEVIDPLNVVDDTYTLKFHNASANYYGLLESGGEWILINSNNDTIHSDYPINKTYNDQLLLDLGLSISIQQVEPAAYKNRNDNRNGLLESSIKFEDETKPWLSFVPDGDDLDPYNWIRVGTYSDGALENPNPNYDDYLGMDPDEYYEKINGGTWGPVYLTSTFKYGPCFDRSLMNIDKYGPLSSVDIVITSDKSKWTRCVVLEMCENEWTTDTSGYEVEESPKVNHLSEGNALRFDLRKHNSVKTDADTKQKIWDYYQGEGDIDDDIYVDDEDDHGMSWFPGYAIDTRTGERLNMAFGEDSWLAGENGDDMLWNPSDGVYNLNGPLFGGKHYIYVFGNTNYTQNTEISTPAYDECEWISEQMREYEENENVMYKRRALSGAMWTSMPYLNQDFDMLETDVKVRIRVATPYFRRIEEQAIEDPQNNNFGMFMFNTTDIQTVTKDRDVAESALDLIRVVPNPYYGHSYYETSQLDNRVRITNLPQKCTISIYDVSGRLIRRFKKANDASYIDWDLKNSHNIAISGGMYIMHIDAPDIGEKVVKWFGSLRPVDLQNF
ncbi:MAG: T9SS type A sorting domain-containing protein, partial [Bacteroidota bacterium]